MTLHDRDSAGRVHPRTCVVMLDALRHSGDDGPMNWSALGKAVHAQRVAMGYKTIVALHGDIGLSVRLLGDLEHGKRQSYDPATLTRVEQFFRWPPGTIDAILRGEPAPPDLAAAFPPYTVPGAPPLSDPARQVQAVMASGLPAERKARFAEAVAALCALATEPDLGELQRAAARIERGKARDAFEDAREAVRGMDRVVGEREG
jgi:hypothetical protein